MLKQIDLPHGCYWREMHLPQLATGPSALSFTPGVARDWQAVVFARFDGADAIVRGVRR